MGSFPFSENVELASKPILVPLKSPAYGSQNEVLKQLLDSLVDPVVGAGGRFFLVLVDVDVEALAIAFELPVGDGVANVVQERTTAEIEVPNEHPAEMTKVTDPVTARSEGHKEFDRTHRRNIRAHWDIYRQWKEPDTAIREENGVGDENSEDRAGCPNRWDIGWRLAKKNRNRLHEEFDQACADSTKEKIVQKTTFPPYEFQFAPEHPKPEHIDEEMSDPTVEKDVSERLPNSKPRNNSGRNQTKDLLDPVILEFGTNENL